MNTVLKKNELIWQFEGKKRRCNVIKLIDSINENEFKFDWFSRSCWWEVAATVGRLIRIESLRPNSWSGWTTPENTIEEVSPLKAVAWRLIEWNAHRQAENDAM